MDTKNVKGAKKNKDDKCTYYSHKLYQNIKEENHNTLINGKKLDLIKMLKNGYMNFHFLMQEQ